MLSPLNDSNNVYKNKQIKRVLRNIIFVILFTNWHFFYNVLRHVDQSEWLVQNFTFIYTSFTTQ